MPDSGTRAAPDNQDEDASPATLSARDAARIKGVSYSAVLRAVRSGQLVSHRVGRVLSIATADLDDWQPGRQAKSAVAGTTSEGRPEPTSRETEALSRVSWLSEILAAGAGESTIERILDRLVADLDLAAASVWTLGQPGSVLRQLLSSGTPGVFPSEGISLRESGAAMSMLRPGLQPSAPGELFALAAAERTERWQLVAPIRADRSMVGLVLLVSSRSQPLLGDDERRWADRLVTVIVAEIVGQRRQLQIEQRSRQLQAVIEALSEAAAVVDPFARILVANTAFRMQFGLQPESIEIGVDLAALLGQVEYLSDAAGKRSVVPRLRAALLASESTTLPLALAPATERGTFRLVLTPVDPAAGPEDQAGASLVRILPPPVRTVEPVASREPVGDGTSGDPPSVGKVDIERVIEFVTALGAGDHLDAVMQAGVDELRDLFGATAGSILLRRADGMLVRQFPRGFDDPDGLETIVDPVQLPSARTAFSERQAVVLRRSTANVHETAALDRAGVDGGMIIPLLVGDRVIGATVLAYFADPADITPEQVTLATALGRYLASALTNARNWDRWGVAQRHLLTVIDQLPQGVLVVDAADGSLLVANRAVDELWGRAIRGTADADDVSALGDAVRGDLVESSASQLTIHDGDGNAFPAGEAPMDRTLRLGERRLGEPLTVVRGDETTVRVIGNHVPILASDGRILSGVGVFQDIEQLREVDRAKDEFLSVVAHELRNPLTSLRGNMQLLQRRLRRQDDASQADEVARLDGLIGQADRINELVSRLLDVSRADLDRISFECNPFDAVALIAGAVEMARGATTKHRFVVDLPSELPVVWDRVRIAQVLDNLLSNAVKYADAGDVGVALREVEDGWVAISVTDAGPGIPDAVKHRVFERYFRASPDGLGADGLGIGLYISSRIVAVHGGSIAITDALTGGAVFTIRLPIDASDDGESG